MTNNQFGFNNPINPYSNYTGINPPYGLNNMQNNLIRVTGLEGAKAYQMSPNSTVALFDNSEDIMYVKSTDGAGFPTIRMFEFRPIEQTTVSNLKTDDYVTKEEFDIFRKEMMEYAELALSDGGTTKGKSSSSK